MRRGQKRTGGGERKINREREREINRERERERVSEHIVPRCCEVYMIDTM